MDNYGWCQQQLCSVCNSEWGPFTSWAIGFFYANMVFFLLFINIYIFKSEIYIKKRTFILSRIFKLILSVKSNFLIVHPQSSLSFSFYFLFFFFFSQWMDNVKKGTKKRGAWTLKFWKRCTYTYIIMFILNFPQNPKLICPAENKQN